MKILHIIIGLNVGGAELMLKRLIESHRSNADYQHMVISLTELGTIGAELRALGVEVIPLGMRSALAFPRALWQLVRLVRRIGPDIVQTWMYHADLLGGLAARAAGNRHVIWGIRTTNVESGGTRSTSLVMRACARLSRLVPHTIVCAADASRRAHAAVGYDVVKMVVVPNGFDLVRLVAAPDQLAVLRAECGIGEDDMVLGIVGRFDPAKDQANFVQAAGLLARQHDHLRFLMVGRGIDAANSELRQWISQTGYADRFILLGERADVPACLAMMDIFCLSSLSEGFPNVVGEAMAMGLPCVVTDVGDASFLIADTGLVVPKQNAALLAEGLGSLVALSPTQRRELGQRAKKRVHAEFTMDRARARFEAIYQRIAGIGVF